MLTAGTLVCKSWLPLAQRLLYHSLHVETSRAYVRPNPGTLEPEALLQQSHLLGFTRSLSICVLSESTTVPLFSGGGGPEGSRECGRIPDFFFLLAHTPRLRYLQLSLLYMQKNIDPAESHILDWLSSLVLPVEALHLDDGVRLNFTFVYDLMGIWPTIRALRVVASYNGVPPPERPNIILRELSLLTPLDALIEVIEWLLPPPPPNEQSNLRFLELYGIPKEALPVLSAHGSSVSSLTLRRQPAFEFAHLFTNLEELVVPGMFWITPLPAFPRTLKHIMLYGNASMSIPVLAAIAQMVPMLPDLRVLSIGKALIAHTHYPDLQEACKAHRVEILVNLIGSSERTVVSTKVPSCLRRLSFTDYCHKHPYHVEMNRFPRQYTFSEFFDIGDRRL